MLDHGRAPPLNALYALLILNGLFGWLQVKVPQNSLHPGLHERLRAAHADRGEVKTCTPEFVSW